MVALQATETVLFGPFWPPYTSQIHARGLAPTPFQTVSYRRSRKFVSVVVYGLPTQFRYTGSEPESCGTANAYWFLGWLSLCVKALVWLVRVERTRR